MKVKEATENRTEVYDGIIRDFRAGVRFMPKMGPEGQSIRENIEKAIGLIESVREKFGADDLIVFGMMEAFIAGTYAGPIVMTVQMKNKFADA